MTEQTAALLAYCCDHGRICPQPRQWNMLYKLLPNTRQIGAGWEPPLPLILAAWEHSSDREKHVRFTLHIQWAAKYAALDKLNAFIRGLPEEDWHHARIQ